MPMMFFYFLKIIFDISTSKRSKKYKLHLILAKKKKIQIWTKRRYKRNTERSRNQFYIGTNDPWCEFLLLILHNEVHLGV
jgi:hypothetical protein